ncbi:hypothetical protein BDV95DRAFT_56721 [Massariosphaeria phaeospora]|uniref:Uncharacterized protein n=1 Tax=Massariosphaeria phaeospora TaxID=100035 RepID=A0A7C8M7X8_9PLEO|nr:hypothetical protein BDV95DRAFT_56721 [Massariosphaeria phaeospora]
MTCLFAAPNYPPEPLLVLISQLTLRLATVTCPAQNQANTHVCLSAQRPPALCSPRVAALVAALHARAPTAKLVAHHRITASPHPRRRKPKPVQRRITSADPSHQLQCPLRIGGQRKRTGRSGWYERFNSNRDGALPSCFGPSGHSACIRRAASHAPERASPPQKPSLGR